MAAAVEPALDLNQQVIVPEDDDKLDENIFETDSDGVSSNDSLSSGIRNYQYENGRRYHAYREGAYFAPNDEREQERMDVHHHIFRLVLNGALYCAPIGDDPERILDIGTGTGLWAIDMADQFPTTTVVGTDLSPIQPIWVPPNCHFEVDDYESAWEFSRPFDFIHGRSLEGTMASPPKVLDQAMKNLKPGGWVELTGLAPVFYADDDTLKNAPYSVEWARVLDEASVHFGKRMNVPHLYRGWMIDAGFQNVKEEVYKTPLNPWAKDRRMKEIGACQQHNMLEALEAYSMALLTRAMGWTPAEVHVHLAEVRKEILNRKIHMYGKIYFVYGQKPEA